MAYVNGNKLCGADQAKVIASFVHRFTGNHIPAWARGKRPDGTAYPLQFANDTDWLANSSFLVRANGRLDNRARFCQSTPTWPNNPELRNTAA